MYERLIYVSRAAEGIGARDAYDIIRTAHNRNSVAGLTGGLLFCDGFFAQVLEGDPLGLRERFERIRQDPRHRDIDVRGHEKVGHRAFPDEWMALRHGDALPAALRGSFGYAPGFPAARFPAARLLDFVRACCDALPA